MIRLSHILSFYPAHEQITEIRSAFKLIELRTCIKFVERTDEVDFIRFVHYPGRCASNVGRVGGGQPIYLDARGCMTRGTIQHEVIHALGYDHMINHVYRDDYIVIDFDNIDPRYQHNFGKVSFTTHSDFGTPYDFYSLMHYGAYAFSADKSRPTIITRDEKYSKIIGQKRGLSNGDILRLNRMYDCPNEPQRRTLKTSRTGRV